MHPVRLFFPQFSILFFCRATEEVAWPCKRSGRLSWRLGWSARCLTTSSTSMFYAACLCWRAPGPRTLCYMVSLAWNGKYNKSVEFDLIWHLNGLIHWRLDCFPLKTKAQLFQYELLIESSRQLRQRQVAHTWLISAVIQEICRSFDPEFAQVDECLIEGRHHRGSFQGTVSIDECSKVLVCSWVHMSICPWTSCLMYLHPSTQKLAPAA